jgi:hypothetical protein
MALHDYSIIGHRRSDIGRWLGAASVVIAPLLAWLIAWALRVVAHWPVLSSSIEGKMAAFTVSAGTIYGILYLIFNRWGWGWRFLDFVLRVPDLRGEWAVQGESLDLNNQIRFPWQGTLTISQRWDTIAVELKTAQSSSYSETASILIEPNGQAKLSYSYQNHPKIGEAELAKHQGFCELIFEKERTSAEGHYFNSLGRYSFGRLRLRKKSP